MKATGCFLLALICIGLLIGVYFNMQASNSLINLQQDVSTSCQQAIPVFERRYQNLEPILRAYEESYGWEWTNSALVFNGDPRQFKEKWELFQAGGLDVTELTPELKPSQTLRGALATFNHSGPPRTSQVPEGAHEGGIRVPPPPGPAFQRMEGVSQVEQNLISFVATAIRANALNDGPALGRLKADILATDEEASRRAETINAAVTRYNNTLDRSYLGKRQGFDFITLNLQMVNGALF